MMQKTKDKALDLVLKYESELADKGIKITVSKKYFETKVEDRYAYHHGETWRRIVHLFNKKRERKYKYQRNRYHSIILSVSPVDKKLIRQLFCKDYAFILRSVERSSMGEEPKHITREENKVLSKIEDRILKIIRKAERCSVQKICKDNLFDVLRYCFSIKYRYKRKILGKERLLWEIVIGIVTVAFILVILGVSSLL